MGSKYASPRFFWRVPSPISISSHIRSSRQRIDVLPWWRISWLGWSMKRGNVVTVAMQGDFEKPRPVLILQSDVFSDIHPTLTVALISSEIVQAPIFRLDIEPSETNGLSRPSQVQIDKIISIRSEKIGSVIGELNDAMMVRVNRALALWLGLA